MRGFLLHGRARDVAQLVQCLPSVREALGLIPHKLRVMAHVSGSKTQQIYAEESEAHGHSGPTTQDPVSKR